ncbi:MAG: hypothetical protein ABSB52_07935 [Acidimicrobiales bacterium]
MKKGRHRRFEEARSLKRAIEVTVEPCPECGADPEEEHASWCLYESEELDELEEVDRLRPGSHIPAPYIEGNGVHDRAGGEAPGPRQS